MMLCCMLLIACRLEIVNGFGKEHHQIANFSNRGVNGIDGTLSAIELLMNQKANFYLLRVSFSSRLERFASFKLFHRQPDYFIN